MPKFPRKLYTHVIDDLQLKSERILEERFSGRKQYKTWIDRGHSLRLKIAQKLTEQQLRFQWNSSDGK